jgi:hypothetical protein
LNGFTDRQLSLLLAFPVFILIAIILGVLILRRDSKYWGNRLFFLCFVFNAFALFFNLLYLFSEAPSFIITFNILSILAINLGTVAMTFAIQVLYYGENEVIGTRRTYIILLLIVIALIVHILIPGAVSTISIEGSLEPYWSLPFGIWELIISQILFISIFYLGLKLYYELGVETRRKFKRFLLGAFFIDVTFVNISINNLRVIPGYETIASLLNGCALIGIILIYFGIVRRSST